MISYQDDADRLRILRLHGYELRHQAEEARRARLARGPRPMRRGIGRMLIALGESMIAAPHEQADGLGRHAPA